MALPKKRVRRDYKGWELYGEEAVQKTIVDTLRIALPDAVVFSVPYKSEKSAYNGWVANQTGRVAGFPDLGVIGIGHNGETVVMFIEVKTAKGEMRDSQKAMHPKLQALGCPTYVCRSAEAAYKVASFHYPVREIQWKETTA